MEKRVILVTGGARSGKSIFAERLASQQGGQVVYLATAAALDREMADRIKAHQEMRPPGWITVEEGLEVVKALEGRIPPGTRAILLDCLTLWISNQLGKRLGEQVPTGKEARQLEMELVEEARKLARCLAKMDQTVIVVSNELGMGVVPEYILGRIFRDAVGKANQLLAETAREVYFLLCGLPWKIKG